MTKNERLDFHQERIAEQGRQIKALEERILQLERSIQHKTPTGRQKPDGIVRPEEC